MGYIEETGVAQHYRDARIAPIYEGTNGIQAMDLVGRKLPMRAGGVIADYLAGIEATADELPAAGDDLASDRHAARRRPRVAAGRPPTGCWPTASPTRATRWPAPRPTCGCSASSPAAGCWPARPWRRSALLDAGEGDADVPRAEGRDRPLLRRAAAAAGGGSGARGHRRPRRPARRRLLTRPRRDSDPADEAGSPCDEPEVGVPGPGDHRSRIRDPTRPAGRPSLVATSGDRPPGLAPPVGAGR